MFSIREFLGSKSDYDVLAKIDSTLWQNHPVTADELRYRENHREKKYWRKRIILEFNNNTAGYGSYGERDWAFVDGGFDFEISVLPKYRRLGGGSMLYEQIIDELYQKYPAKLSSYSREDQKDGMYFLEKRGYIRTLREPESVIYPQEFNGEQFIHYIQKLNTQKIFFYSLNEIDKIVYNWKEKLYDIEWEICQDIPFPDPPTKPPFDVWEKQTFDPGRFTPDSYFVAADGKNIVGVSCLKKVPADSKKMSTMLTGTARKYRRRGIATALKTACINTAKRMGVKEIMTDNEENNPMYQLNLRLGFKPLPAWLHYEKTL